MPVKNNKHFKVDHSGVRYSKEDIKRRKVERKFDKRSIKKTGVCGRQLKNNEALRNVNSRKKIVEDHLAMPLSQMFDKVFGMIKTDIREPSGGQTPENLENSENSTRDP